MASRSREVVRLPQNGGRGLVYCGVYSGHTDDHSSDETG